MLRKFSPWNRRRPGEKPLRKNCTLRAESLESRMMLSATDLLSPVHGYAAFVRAFTSTIAPQASPVLAGQASSLSTQVNRKPLVSTAAASASGPVVAGSSTTLSALGADEAGEAGLVYSWSATSSPRGASVIFGDNGTNSAKNTTVTFNRVGAYTLTVRITDAGGLSTASSTRVTVVPILSNIVLIDKSSRAPVNAVAPVSTTDKTDIFIIQGYDQFGIAMNTMPAYSWSATVVPEGAQAPRFSGNSKNAVVSFSSAGAYGLAVQATNLLGNVVASTMMEIVRPVLKAFTTTPSSTSITVPGATQQIAVQQVIDQFGRDMSSLTTVAWSVASYPRGASVPTITVTDSKSATYSFSQAGSYQLAVRVTDPVAGRSIAKYISARVTFTPSLAGLSVTPSDAIVNGTTQSLVAQGLDQLGRAIASGIRYTWQATTIPQGASAPTFSVNGTTAAQNTTAAFSAAGSYVITVKATDSSSRSFSRTVSVVVHQSLSRITVTSAEQGALLPGQTRQFTASALDQFDRAMALQPTFDWTSTAGTISAGLLTAPNTTGSVIVTAASGSIYGSATVTVGSALGLQDAALDSLVQSLYADGSISRADMIRILRSVGLDDGVVDSLELADLRAVLSMASTLHIADYVRVLAGDVVYSNPANAHYQGQLLGNLSSGSSASHLNKLVDKWFLGADHPVAAGYTYRQATGSLFVNGPAYTDTNQGYLGDCYYIASLGVIAKASPSAIANMILDNGDGTWTVRFYSGAMSSVYTGDSTWDSGYQGTAMADYVTVDSMLPTDSYGRLIFANMGDMHNSASNELWIPLVEKAYAQWNETGRTGRGGTDAMLNNYNAIEGGWMSDVYNQVLGRDAVDASTSGTNARQTLINALAANKAVTIGSNSFSGTSNGLYGNHAYQVVGYNSSNGTFTLHNPWGVSHPGPLTWTQLQSSCSFFAIGDASGTSPISTVQGGQANAQARARAIQACFARFGSPASDHGGLAGARLHGNGGRVALEA